MKRKKVVALLMSGIIALSQPVSLINNNLVHAEEIGEYIEAEPMDETLLSPR